MYLRTARNRLQFVLWLVAVHSAAVAVGLMAHPVALLERLGFAAVGEPFFPTQGGVFHLVMAVGYAMAAWSPDRNRCLAVFSIVVKVLATLFLLVYWFVISRLPAVLLSGLVDGAMAVMIALAYAAWRREQAREVS